MTTDQTKTCPGSGTGRVLKRNLRTELQFRLATHIAIGSLGAIAPPGR